MTNILFAFAIAITSMPCQAENPRQAEFRSFYSKFLAAVRANDKIKIAEAIAFPVQEWSVIRKDNFENVGVKGKAEFLAKYGTFFTPFMRSQIFRGTLQKISDDHYRVTFYDSYAEYNIDFEYTVSNAFRMTAVKIGPP